MVVEKCRKKKVLFAGKGSFPTFPSPLKDLSHSWKIKMHPRPTYSFSTMTAATHEQLS
jgi:hypothetical protein